MELEARTPAHSAETQSNANDHSLLALIPPVEPARDRFSTMPSLMLEQAQRIEIWPMPEDSDTGLPTSGSRASHLLLLARDTKTNDIVSGCEVIAYPCDSTGRVASWSHRYTSHAVNFALAAQKLRLQIVNNLTTMHHVENA